MLPSGQWEWLGQSSHTANRVCKDQQWLQGKPGLSCGGGGHSWEAPCRRQWPWVHLGAGAALTAGPGSLGLLSGHRRRTTTDTGRAHRPEPALTPL